MPDNADSVLITGGTGFIGGALALRLLSERQMRVRLLGRDFRKAAHLQKAGAETVVGDLRDGVAVAEACSGADTVFHIGALSTPWSPGGRQAFYDTNVAGTENVISACQCAGVRRLVYVSSPSVVFDGKDHCDLTEAAPFPRRFASHYSWSKKLGEDRVNAAATTGLETIILRPKAVFGAGDTSLLPRLITAAKAGRLPQIGDGQNEVDLTHVDNVVEALCQCLQAPETALGRTFTITGGESACLWDVIRQVLDALRISTTLRAIPLGVALAGAALMESRAAFTKREPLLTRYSARILARTQTYDIFAARRYLGYAPIVSLADGIERTIAALQQEYLLPEIGAYDAA